MRLIRLIVWVFPVGLMVLGAGAVSGQNYPNKPIHVFTAEPGGDGDFVARIVAPGLAGPLGQPVIVENRPAPLLVGIVAKAPADGYTLLLQGSPVWLLPLLQKTSYDPLVEFSPISMLTRVPLALVVHPSLPVKSVKELIALAKARPGELNYALGGIGSSPHLAAELFKSMTGIKMAGISYKGSGPGLIGLMGGEVQLMFTSTSATGPHIKSGRLRALAVTSTRRSLSFPELPTIAESGVAGYESVSTLCLFAPAKTPEAIVDRLNQETVRMLNTAYVKDQFIKSGTETVGNSRGEFVAKIKSEMAIMGKVIRDAGIKVE